MKKTYTISGMTCNSCKSTIHQNLNEIPEVESVEVNLEKAEAIIFMKSNIEISKLQNVLPSKLARFCITDCGYGNGMIVTLSIEYKGSEGDNVFSSGIKM